MEQVETFGVVHSESLCNLAAAMSKFQGKLRGAKKESVNPGFGSKYSDLESVWEAIRGPLAEHGLSIIQLPGGGRGFMGLFTYLMHESGEYIGAEMRIASAGDENKRINVAQAMGSLVSYMRRYALAAVTGLYQTDDDGNASGVNEHKAAVSEKLDNLKGEMEKKQSPPLTDKPKISEAQGKRLYAIAKAAGWSDGELKSFLRRSYNIDHSRDINRSDYDSICQTVQAGSFPQPQSDKATPIENEDIPF